jgi:hypothetical protein
MGWHPNPLARPIRCRSLGAVSQKLVFFARFFKVLVKSAPLAAGGIKVTNAILKKFFNYAIE